MRFNATKNVGESKVGVDASGVCLGQKLMDSEQQLTDTSDDEDAENSGSMFCKLKTKMQLKNDAGHKNSTTQNNTPCSGKGEAGNFHDSEKRHDIINASRNHDF